MNLRRFLHKALVNKTLVYFAASVIYILSFLLFITCRKKVIRSPKIRELENTSSPLIYAFWHGRIFPMPFLRPKKRKVYSVISRHGDGELITALMRLFGVYAVRGSANRVKPGVLKHKDRGGSRVIRESIRVLESGHNIVVTPDGPRGPRFIFKPNFLTVAAVSKAPILPVSYSASRAWVFKSWDRFILPKPFSRITVEYGEPVYILSDASGEESKTYGKLIENSLNDITSRLDAKNNILLH